MHTALTLSAPSAGSRIGCAIQFAHTEFSCHVCQHLPRPHRVARRANVGASSLQGQRVNGDEWPSHQAHTACTASSSAAAGQDTTTGTSLGEATTQQPLLQQQQPLSPSLFKGSFSVSFRARSRGPAAAAEGTALPPTTPPSSSSSHSSCGDPSCCTIQVWDA